MSIQLNRFNGDVRIETSEDGIKIYPLKSLSGIFISWKELEQIILSASTSNLFLIPLLGKVNNMGSPNGSGHCLWNRESNILSAPILSGHEEGDS